MPGEEKVHSSGLILSNPDILLPTNSEIHYSPAMNNGKDKTKNRLYKLMKVSLKLTIFGYLWCSFSRFPVFVLVFLFKNRLKAHIS